MPHSSTLKEQSAPRPSAHSLARFRRYSATALALTGSAAGTQAAIVYSNPTDVTLAGTGSTRVNFLAGTFGGSGLTVSYSGSEYVELVPSAGGVNATARDGGTFGQLSRFSFGSSIGSAGGANGWDTGFNYADYHNAGGYAWNTNANGTTGYIGVRLNNNGTTSGTYYGWVRMTYDDASNSLTLHDFAYQTTADLAINAGAVPEPAETGILAALGAGGLAAWRRLRKSRRA